MVPDDAVDGETLVRRADERLLRRKRSVVVRPTASAAPAAV